MPHHRSFIWYVALLAITTGCTGGATVSNASVAGPQVSIVYEKSPLADCHITLHVRSGSEFREQWQGLSGANGVATLTLASGANTSLPLAGSYRASLVSHGDGGWLLDTRFADPKTSGIDVSLAETTTAEVKLPAGAVKPL
jgi:hypothetical protein